FVQGNITINGNLICSTGSVPTILASGSVAMNITINGDILGNTGNGGTIISGSNVDYITINGDIIGSNVAGNITVDAIGVPVNITGPINSTRTITKTAGIVPL